MILAAAEAAPTNQENSTKLMERIRFLFESPVLVNFALRIQRCVWPVLLIVSALAMRSHADDHFLQQVAPVLQAHCVGCHSGSEPKGDFSLATGPEILNSGYVERGDSAASHLMDLIRSVDGKADMPRDGKPLTPAQVAAIEKWIDEGAPWPTGFVLEQPRISSFDWWSFRPLVRPEVPSAGQGWARNPIDQFVADGMNRHGLVPSKEADRRTLIRRLTYDLTGLPPTPDEVVQFLNDRRPEAYSELVERLLQSPHYGERWARHWLDVVKYADTHGYDKDKLRPNAWPYRDYVIRAFNEDKPYSKFMKEQIAGDVLFPGQPDGILGLGFIAAGPWDFIGHVEVSEAKIDGKVARNLDRDDMVSNTFNTFCSITVQCARCHNHKFDPITQEDYYGLQQLFAAVDRADRRYDVDDPSQLVRNRLTARQSSEQAELKQLDEQLAAECGDRLGELDVAIQDALAKLELEKTARFGFHSQISDHAQREKWIQLTLPKPTVIKSIVLHPCHDEYAGIGAGFGFPIRYRLEVDSGEGNWIQVVDRTTQDQPNPGISAIAIDADGQPIKRIRLTATHLRERAGDYHLALAEVELIDPEDNNLASQTEVEASDSIEAPERWSTGNLVDGQWPVGKVESVRRLANLNAERHEITVQFDTPERQARRTVLNASLKQVQDQLDRLPTGKLVYAATTEFAPEGSFQPTKGQPRAVFVLHRGNVQTPAETAQPRVLALRTDDEVEISPALSEADRRAALANWLAQDDHPLVWRSIVNRVWQNHFGVGLVSTPNDFGRMGSEPSHPELLDWLAVEFRDSGQSFKQLHRLMVNSAVYRQSSSDQPANAQIDGSNRYLWRMTRRRLSAEEVRDSILQISGALDRRMGGPGYYLFNLEKTEHSPHYEYHQFDHSDSASHRRSIYRFVVRSQPNPWMSTLDCADSSQSTPTRIETLTSLQALTLLNNDFNLVMAEQMAGDLSAAGTGLPQQVQSAVGLALQRPPAEWEREAMLAYAQQHGLANLCRLLFNLSEFVFVD